VTYSLHIAAILSLLMITALGQAAQPATKIGNIANPAALGAQSPRFAVLPAGAILMSWVEPVPDGHALKYGVLRDGRWTHKGEAARGNDWFVNWSDFPSVVPIDESFWVAHWLVNKDGENTYHYDIAISVSRDAGITWSAPRPPYRSATAQYGFATIFPVHGSAGVIWLDGRDRRKRDRGGKSVFTLRYARIHRDGSMDSEQIIDSSTCTCCWTTVSVTPTGPVAAWRGRTENEIRDHRVARLLGDKWSAPTPLGKEGWEIDGCPVNGPMLSARGMQVAAAWFTAQGDRPRVNAAFSTDGGQSFGQTMEVDGKNPTGRVGLGWIDDRTAVISWVTAPDLATMKSHLVLRKLYTDGSSSRLIRLAEISAGRDSGVPQMVADGSNFLFSWTGEAPDHGVHMISVSRDWLRNL
jgi:hypothetical protein